MTLPDIKDIISNKISFDEKALLVFQYQYQTNFVYHKFCDFLNKTPTNVNEVKNIPFLPISFFKTHKLLSSKYSEYAIKFSSSGTTGNKTSSHYVGDLSWYEASFLKSFELFYGKPEDYTFLALLPSYLERKGSSLIYMADKLIQLSKSKNSGFYLNNLDELILKIHQLESQNKKTILIGVSFALLDLIEKQTFNLKHTIVMETGGMKGQRKELIREELHTILKKGFGTKQIHSEYGMTELLSQAYSKGNGLFETPPWMKILIRDTEDALTTLGHNKTGGINIIDLANIHSCSFIATQDLGKSHSNNSFEVLGRFDSSDIRGCNLMVV